MINLLDSGRGLIVISFVYQLPDVICTYIHNTIHYNSMRLEE